MVLLKFLATLCLNENSILWSCMPHGLWLLGCFLYLCPSEYRSVYLKDVFCPFCCGYLYFWVCVCMCVCMCIGIYSTLLKFPAVMLKFLKKFLIAVFPLQKLSHL